ncbi:MAG: hypothetical protein M0R03_23680 [Novosphingobium sp.]|nr:hypothetical protein [Novosphingobium sp.]
MIYEVYEYHTETNKELNNLENRFNSLGLYYTQEGAINRFKNELEFQCFDDGNGYWKYLEITSKDSDLQENNFICGVKLYWLEDLDSEIENKDDYCYQLAVRKIEVE